MFSFSKKKEYESRVRKAIEKDRYEEAADIGREAFADKDADETILAWIAAAMYERNIEPAFDLIHSYVDRFPDSLHLPRIYLADLLSRAGQFDPATNMARIYLRQTKDAGCFEDLSSSRYIRNGVSRAFLLITAAYTELGARSYSKRALQYGQELNIEERWHGIISKELQQLEQELKQEENKEIDAKWEAFFASGVGATALYDLCIEKGFPVLARRIDLIEGNFRFKSNFRTDRSEIFLLVFTLKENEYLLN